MTSLVHHEVDYQTHRDQVAALAANPDAPRRAAAFFNDLLDHGVMIGASGLFVLSTALTEADIDQVCEVSLGALRRLQASA